MPTLSKFPGLESASRTLQHSVYLVGRLLTCYAFLRMLYRMSWYFGIMCVAGMISTIWSAGVMEPRSIRDLPEPTQRYECGKINDFLYIYALVYVPLDCLWQDLAVPFLGA